MSKPRTTTHLFTCFMGINCLLAMITWFPFSIGAFGGVVVISFLETLVVRLAVTLFHEGW